MNGIADNNKLMVQSVDENGRHILIYPGNRHLYEYIQNDKFNKAVINLDTDLNQQIKTSQFDAIFNQISDADTHKTTLMKMEQIHKEYVGKIPFFNPPANVRKTTKENIYQLLQGIDKLNIPKTIKIQAKSPSDIYHAIKKEGFQLPLILRQVKSKSTARELFIKQTDEMFRTVPLDGRDYYLTQPVDTQSNMHPIYRLVVVDGEVFIGNAIFNIEGKPENEDAEYLKKEGVIADSFDIDIKPNIQSIITEIYNRLDLDYFSMDCTIDENFNIIFLNLSANINLFINPHKESKRIWTVQAEQIQNAIVAMLEKKV